jgi:hypothetical protein
LLNRRNHGDVILPGALRAYPAGGVVQAAGQEHDLGAGLQRLADPAAHSFGRVTAYCPVRDARLREGIGPLHGKYRVADEQGPAVDQEGVDHRIVALLPGQDRLFCGKQRTVGKGLGADRDGYYSRRRKPKPPSVWGHDPFLPRPDAAS